MLKTFFIIFWAIITAAYSVVTAQSRYEWHTQGDTVAAGTQYELILEIEHQPTFHSYYVNPGAVGRPLAVKWELPQGVTVEPQKWPTPKRWEQFGMMNYGYEGRQLFIYTLNIPADYSAENLAIKGGARWQVCDDQSCVFEPMSRQGFIIEKNLSIVNPSEVVVDESFQSLKQQAVKKLPLEPADIKLDEIKVADQQATLVIATNQKIAKNLASVELYEAANWVDAQQAIEVSQAEQGWQIIAPIKEGAIAPSQFEAILVSDELKEGVLLQYQLSSEVAAPANEIKEENNTAESDSVNFNEIKAIAAQAYDAQQPINFVPLLASSNEVTGGIQAWLLIFVAGLILNLMPCVFPILSLKVMGFVDQAGESKSKIRAHGLTFTLGVLLSMWVLAIIVASLGSNFSWGQQLSEPIVVAVLIILFALLGLNLMGLFEMGVKLTSLGAKQQSKSGYAGSFFSGVLMTLVATPCSGPFLGPLMAYALGQPMLSLLGLFGMFALGIAAPYLWFSIFPGHLNFMPRPGKWMLHFKHILSVGMWGAVIFFAWTFWKLTGNSGLIYLVIAIVALSVLAWYYGKSQIGKFKMPQSALVIVILASITLGLSYWASLQEPALKVVETPQPVSQGELQWEPWYPGKIEQIQQEKPQIIWVDYTATWCATCQFNKQRIFNDESVIQWIKQNDVRLIKVDMTAGDEATSQDLYRIGGRKSIPVNLVYPLDSSKPAILMEGLISPANALEALKKSK